MSWFVSKIYDRFMASAEREVLGDWRRNLLARAEGRVLEVGAGTGLNLEYYPPEVTDVTAVEPDPHMRAELARRVERAPNTGVRLVDARAEQLPFADDAIQDAGFDIVDLTRESMRKGLPIVRPTIRGEARQSGA